MKIIKYSELATKTNEAPFYCVTKDNPSGFSDGRAFGCGTLAFLNLVLLLKNRLGVSDGKTALDELQDIQLKAPESDQYRMSIANAMGFIEASSLFNRTRILCLNPSAMNPEVFLEIALRRLLSGDIVLAMIEVSAQAASPAGSVNHLSVIHSENGDVFFDGLPLDMETFLDIVLYSPANTLFFISKNMEVES